MIIRREAPATTLRQNLGEFLNQVQRRGESVMITRGGKPVAALVDYALYERIHRLQESFMTLTDKLGQVHADVPPETAAAELDALTEQFKTRLEVLQQPQSRDRLGRVLASKGKAKRAPTAGNDF